MSTSPTGMATDRTVEVNETVARVKTWGPVDILSANHNRGVLVKLAKYSLAMGVTPIGVFMLFRDLEPFGRRHRDSVAAVASILALNAIIALYVIDAFFFEEEPPDATDDKVKRLGRWKEERVE